MHHVILFVFTEAQHGGTQCGCGKGESKAKKTKAKSSQQRDTITCADKKHASSVNNYILCQSTAISDNPRQSTAPSDLL